MDSKPLRTGIALAGTTAVFYALCTLAWILAPDAFLSFMNGLFHGMDFSAMVKSPQFSGSGFLLALVVLSTWALGAGTFFSWLLNRLGR